MVHHNRPNVRKAHEIAAELIARAEEHGSARHIADAETGLALVRMIAGDFDLAAQGFERAMARWESISEAGNRSYAAARPANAQVRRSWIAYQRLGNRAFNRVASAHNLWCLGYPDRAVERVSIATTFASESGSKAVLEMVHWRSLAVYALRGELERMRERADAGLVLSTELGNPARRAISEIYLGSAQALVGDLEGGIARMRHHLSALRATGSELMTDYFVALIAIALGRMGRSDEALRTINESFSFIERTGARCFEAEVHRLKGELILAQDASNATRAVQSFRTAVDISRKQKAKSWELRATTSLARLLAHRGQRDEARAMLAAIYGWFSEGFDTADLKDAKSLLDELRP